MSSADLSRRSNGSEGSGLARSNSMNLAQQSDSKRNAATGPAANGKARKRPGKGKGRPMMIKVFYSLQSSRFGSNSNSTPQASSSNTTSPDFFAVLDPSLASNSSISPSPQPDQPNPATNYSCIARLSAPVWVQVVGSRKNANEEGGERTQYGKITLKTCLSAICISRPELVIDSMKDFSVSAVDPYESSSRNAGGPPTSQHGLGASTASSRSHEPGQGLVEGKGMLSWTLAEKKEGTTMVCGRITGSESDARRSKRRKGDDGSAVGMEDDEDSGDEGDETEETLEIWLQLSERDAFTQGQFLDCLRSYHNPVQQLQSEISDYNKSSPPKPTRRETAPFAPSSSTSTWQPRSSGPSIGGDPDKRKRKEGRQSLPLSTSTTALPIAPASAFSNLSASTPSERAPAASTSEGTIQNPALLALLSHLVSASANSPSAPSPLANVVPNEQTLQALAQFCGMTLPAQSSNPPPPPPAPFAPTSTSGPLPEVSNRPSKETTSNAAESSTGDQSRKKSTKPREHFSAIEQSAALGKQNPRNPKGCSNCNRKKSTLWREGMGPDGIETSVCNACGTFFNKNGYHRSKGANDQTARTTPPLQSASIFPSHAAAPSSSTATTSSKPGRPLTGRLTATCEADLVKRKTKKKNSIGSIDSVSSSSRPFQPGIIPPLSPSKHVGPRSPSLSFGFGYNGRSSGSRAPGIMSSPGRSPRLRYRHGGNGASATSPVRGPSDNFGADAGAQDGGFDFAALFGGMASPSPKKRPVSGNNSGGSGGKAVPSYLLTASPGTALDRILNDTNIGAFTGCNDPMQVDQHSNNARPSEGSNPFNFFLQPGSPTFEKENERPRSSTTTTTHHGGQATNEAPTTDLDSFESVLSSLRRDFSNRLSSNALTAPSSPIPSSPCVQPRTSTATPGSKGKAPMSSGRPPPSIFDSFTDSLVPAVVTNVDPSTGRTPQSDSDAWSPANAQDGEDQTITLDSITQATTHSTRSQSGAEDNIEYSHLLLPNKINGGSRRSGFLPAHVVAPSDATDFDLGSLPPSSPPQLPSEAFPTPSDFDGITPGTDGGDLEERTEQDHDQLTIEAVAEKVATEPNEEARNMIMALLQSVKSGNKDVEKAVELPGMAGGDKITLDRATVDKLLSLISTKPEISSASPRASTTSSASPANPKPVEASTSARENPMDSRSDESPDLSQIDFFKAFAPSPNSQPPSLHHTEQMNGLYSDLFSQNPF